MISGGFEAELTEAIWDKEAMLYGHPYLEVDKTYSIIFTSRSMWSSDPRVDIYAWLYKNREPVSMAQILFQEDPSERSSRESVIGSIETKPEVRRLGYGKQIVNLLAKELFKGELYSGGSYTPEGFAAFHNRLPLTKEALIDRDRRSVNSEQSWVTFQSMNFVEDWSKRHLKL